MWLKCGAQFTGDLTSLKLVGRSTKAKGDSQYKVSRYYVQDTLHAHRKCSRLQRGLGQNLTTHWLRNSDDLMKSIATGPFKVSLYLNLAFETCQETYQVFCIMRRSQRVSTPYRKTLCCCPLSFHSSRPRNTRDHDSSFDNQGQFAFYDFHTEAPVIV